MPIYPHTPAPLPSAKARRVRARSLPSSRPFNVAVLVSVLHCVGMITTATAVVLVLSGKSPGNPAATHLIFGGLGFSAVTWLIALFKRRAARCPLCKGTPLINSGALAHSKATRIRPFNHGISAVISIMVTQKFCCMYCASNFDLLKTPSHLRGPGSSARKPSRSERHQPI